MKLEANVKLQKPVDGHEIGDVVTVNVDADYYIHVDTDYISLYESDIREYVANELYVMFGCSFEDDEFEIENLEDLMKDLY